MRSLLAIPIVYRSFCRILGEKRGRTILVSEYIKAAPGDRLLDIGCGEATILDYLPDVEYVGFDASASYIEAARKRHGNRGRFHCRMVTRDAIGDIGSFDIVLAIGILHHLTDAESQDLFQLATRALKDKGRLVTFDGSYVPDQSPVARCLLKADRGKFVRTPAQYLAMAKQVFPVVNGSVRQDLLAIPYTHFIMECVKA